MAVTIARSSWIDDDGTGTTGTVINNAVKTDLYNQIDGALAQVFPVTGGTISGNVTLTGGLNVNGNLTGTNASFSSLTGINASFSGGLTAATNAIIGASGATPSAKLDVIGIVDSTSAIAMRLAGTFSGSGIGIHFSDAATYNTFAGANGFGDFQVVAGRYPGVAGTERFAVKTGGGLRVAGSPAFAAGDKYLVIDASGNVHVSALGPAS